MPDTTTIKITEKAVATENKSDQYVLITQTENGVHSLRRVARSTFFQGVVQVDDDGKFYVEEA